MHASKTLNQNKNLSLLTVWFGMCYFIFFKIQLHWTNRYTGCFSIYFPTLMSTKTGDKIKSSSLQPFYISIYTHSYIFLFFSSPHSKQNLFYNNKKYKKIGSNLSPSFLFVVLNTYICTCVDACGCMLFTAFPYFLPSCNNNSFVGVYLSWFFIIFRNPMLINWKACGGGLWDGCRQVKWICSSIHPTSIHVYLCTFKYRFRLLILSFIPIFCTVIFLIHSLYMHLYLFFRPSFMMVLITIPDKLIK